MHMNNSRDHVLMLGNERVKEREYYGYVGIVNCISIGEYPCTSTCNMGLDLCARHSLLLFWCTDPYYTVTFYSS